MGTFAKYMGEWLTGLAALLTAVVGFLSWHKSCTQTSVYKASTGNAAIADMLQDIAQHFGPKTIASLLEVSNGGGVPEVGKPLYMRCILSSDHETQNVFGEKFLMETNLITLHSRLILKGDMFFLPSELQNNMTRAWYETKEIARTHAFLVGIQRDVRTLVVMVNTTNPDLMPQKSYFFTLAKVGQIRNIIAPGGLFKKKQLVS